MGGFMQETPDSEIKATLEIFDALGIQRDDLRRLRADRKLAEQVVRCWLEAKTVVPSSRPLPSYLSPP